MKNLANCNPKEFLVQTNKIRKAVSKWLDDTGIMNIRKRVPKFDANVTGIDRRKALEEQSKKNLKAMLDAVLEEYPEETAELLGLLCFVEPEDLENHKMTEFLGAFNEIINSPEVIGFFTSLMQLVQMNTSNTPIA